MEDAPIMLSQKSAKKSFIHVSKRVHILPTYKKYRRSAGPIEAAATSAASDEVPGKGEVVSTILFMGQNLEIEVATP
jgi:hypothetical protein